MDCLTSRRPNAYSFLQPFAELVGSQLTVSEDSMELGPRRLEQEAAWIERYRRLWEARFDELDKIVASLNREERLDRRKKRK